MINEKEEINYNFYTGKSRVAPRELISIPRFEQTAAVLYAKVGASVKKELSINTQKEYFCRCNQVVLGYIKNETR